MTSDPFAKETSRGPDDCPPSRATSHDNETAKPHPLKREPTREEKTAEACAEGHDADIPSSLGYVLDERGERRRRESLARQRRASNARKPRGDDAEKGRPATEDGDGGESSEDENVVWWDGDDDPDNPYNWPAWRKAMTCSLISAMTFVTPFASCTCCCPHPPWGSRLARRGLISSSGSHFRPGRLRTHEGIQQRQPLPFRLRSLR